MDKRFMLRVKREMTKVIKGNKKERKEISLEVGSDRERVCPFIRLKIIC